MIIWYLKKNHENKTMSGRPTSTVCMVDPFDAVDTTFISVKRGYSRGNSDYLGPF